MRMVKKKCCLRFAAPRASSDASGIWGIARVAIKLGVSPQAMDWRPSNGWLKRMAKLGVDAIELPIRPGYRVTPDNVTTSLPNAVKVLAKRGLTICSIALRPARRPNRYRLRRQ